MAGPPRPGEFGTELRTPAIPDVRTAQVEDVILAVKEWIEVRQGTRGDGLDRAVTLRDLLNSGMATPFDLRHLAPGYVAPIPLDPNDTSPDIPPRPDNLVASGALKYVILTWDFPPGYSRLAYFEVWRSATNALGDAVVAGQTYAPIYADDVGPGSTNYYWVRAVSDVATGPFNKSDGTLGQTAIDPGYLLELLEGQIRESHLFTDLGERINLIDADEQVTGSVTARVKAETDARVEAVQAEVDARIAAILGEQQARTTYVQTYTYSKAESDESLSFMAYTITAAYTQYADGTRDAAITTAAADVRNYAYSKANTDSAIATTATTLRAEITTAQSNAEAYVRNYSYSEAETDSAISATATTLRAEITTAQGNAQAYTNTYAYSKAQIDASEAAQTSSITTAYTNYANTKKGEAVTEAAADVRNYGYSKATVDASFASQSSSITAAYTLYADNKKAEAISVSSADVRSYSFSKAETNSAIASATSTLQSTVDGHTTSIQTQATSINGLSGQYTVKVDNNGYVAGYGLANTLVGSTPYSSFIIRSDNFAIGAPQGPGVVAPAIPFVVVTTATTINGVAVGPGIYVADAFIANGVIGNAKIGNLAVDDAKMASVSVAKLLAGSLQVGAYIQSTNYLSGSTGFHIHANGNAEFSNATVRGAIYATSGQIGGNTIDASGMQSPNYGATTGWRLNSNGSFVINDAYIRGTLYAVNGTLGTIEIATGGYIRSGATAYSTGTGWWIGHEGGVPKFFVGDSTQYVRWTGTALEIKLNTFSCSITGTLPTAVSNGPVIYGSVGSTSSGGVGPMTYIWQLNSMESDSGVAVQYTVEGGTTTATLKGSATNNKIHAYIGLTVIDSNGRVCSAIKIHRPVHGTYAP